MDQEIHLPCRSTASESSTHPKDDASSPYSSANITIKSNCISVASSNIVSY
jgi:hypothetical protein